jgi:hypothetical protein
MLRKILHPLLALTLAAGMGITTAEQAQAGRGAGVATGIAAGIIGLGIIGATAGPRRGYYYDAYDGPGGCYRGPRTCDWETGIASRTATATTYAAATMCAGAR